MRLGLGRSIAGKGTDSPAQAGREAAAQAARSEHGACVCVTAVAVWGAGRGRGAVVERVLQE